VSSCCWATKHTSPSRRSIRRPARGEAVPELEVESVGTFEVEESKRPVLAFEEDARVDIMHACGSYAKCSTCRVAYLAGEPEYEVMILDMRDLLGRLGSRARSTPTTTEGKAACEGKRHQRRRLLAPNPWRRSCPSPSGSRDLIERCWKTRAAVAPRTRVAYHQRHKGPGGNLRDRLSNGGRR
jgi:ferredoxin